ncbi:MAG TPA: hypothetical protein VFF69_05280 [Phycisphaerales bacterium]|nr:hypothetical protein [Phycisphaerales bacterium]
MIKRPHAVFQGIRWEEDEDRLNHGCNADSWLCYSLNPGQYYDPSESEPQPSNPEEVFLVFVNVERIAYHWRWDDVDEDGSGLPRGWRTRFRERVL